MNLALLPDDLVANLLSFSDLQTRFIALGTINKRFRTLCQSNALCHCNIHVCENSEMSVTRSLAWMQFFLRSSFQTGKFCSGISDVVLTLPALRFIVIHSFIQRLIQQHSPVNRLKIGRIRVDFASLCHAVSKFSSLSEIDFTSCIHDADSSIDLKPRESSSFESFFDLESALTLHMAKCPWMHALGTLVGFGQSIKFSNLQSLHLPPLDSTNLVLVMLASIPIRALTISISSASDGSGQHLAKAMSLLSQQCPLAQNLEHLNLIVHENTVSRSDPLFVLNLPEFAWNPLLPAAVAAFPFLLSLHGHSHTLTDDAELMTAINKLCMFHDIRLQSFSLDLYLPISKKTIQSLLEFAPLSSLVFRTFYSPLHTRFVELSFLKYDSVDTSESILSSLLSSLHDVSFSSSRLHRVSSIVIKTPFFIPSASSLKRTQEMIHFPDFLQSLTLGSECWMHFDPITQPSHHSVVEMFFRISALQLKSLTLEFDSNLILDNFDFLASAFPRLSDLTLSAMKRCVLPLVPILRSIGSQLERLRVSTVGPFNESDLTIITCCENITDAIFLEREAKSMKSLFDARISIVPWIRSAMSLRSLTLSATLVQRMWIRLRSNFRTKELFVQHLKSLTVSLNLHIYSHNSESNCTSKM
jgi:hypothetical protein